MKILIRFPGDNDFSNVLYKFATLIKDNYPYNKDSLNREDIARQFNTIASTLHEMTCGYKDDENHKKSLANYIKIIESDVYLNEEVDKKMESYSSWGNGDSVLLTLDEYLTSRVDIV